ncbi:hypothetical protein VTN00DRAFT_1742 [Thermoascus crustaceus]|uniref:uncharacterized protein n=1 Tax=Thermoascus crustaceus TaxID=5088 RepID=UPI003742A532
MSGQVQLVGHHPPRGAEAKVRDVVTARELFRQHFYWDNEYVLNYSTKRCKNFETRLQNKERNIGDALGDPPPLTIICYVYSIGKMTCPDHSATEIMGLCTPTHSHNNRSGSIHYCDMYMFIRPVFVS